MFIKGKKIIFLLLQQPVKVNVGTSVFFFAISEWF